MALTIPQIINIARVSQYLANSAAAKGSLFNPVLDPLLGLKIYVIRKDVEDVYDLDPTYDGLVACSNYLLGLCGAYALTAQGIISGGGGSITPGQPTIIQSPIYITGANFASATAWNGANSAGVTILAAYTLQVFWNDVNRFLIEGTEWSRTSTGVTILITDFNATTTNLESVFFIYISA